MRLGRSSYVYSLYAADVERLGNPPRPVRRKDLPDDPVIVMIAPGEPDALVRGRHLVAAAAAEGRYIAVRVVFVPAIPAFNPLAQLVRPLRNRRRYKGAGIYRMRTRSLREMGIERALRTLDCPQSRKGIDREASMRRLEESLRTSGYDYSRPVEVMLCRSRGNADSLRQGHHRISACRACGVEVLSVRFSAAGMLPSWLAALLGRRAERPEVVRSALECRYGIDISRIVPRDGVGGDTVIVVPQRGGRFVARVRGDTVPSIGIASAVAVPSVALAAMFIDLAVLRSARGLHSVVAWSQFAFAAVSTGLMAFLTVAERGARAFYAAIGGVFLALTAYELLRDIETLRGAWVAYCAAGAGLACALPVAWRWRRTLGRGYRRVRRERTFMALPLGLALVLGVSQIVSRRELYEAFRFSASQSIFFRHFIEEGVELLGYVTLFCWTFAFFCARLREWRLR